MATLIFVHGTGVREDSYAKTFEVIRSKLDDLNTKRQPRAPIALATCEWGKTLGVDLNLKGDSIPDYVANDGIRLLPNTTTDDDLDVLLWSALARDPLYELRELARQDSESQGVG